MNNVTSPSVFVPGTQFMFADGRSALASSCIVLLQVVGEILPALLPGELYTLEALCGPEFWCQLTTAEKQDAGRIMVRLVLGGWLPLEVVGCRHAFPKQYRLKT